MKPRHLHVVPDADPDTTWDVTCAVAMFRAIREDVSQAVAYALATELPAEPISVCDATIGITLAALRECGWLVIPERPDPGAHLRRPAAAAEGRAS